MEMPILKPRAEVIASLVIASIILFFTLLAVRSLFVRIAIIPSALWLSLVTLHLFASYRTEGARTYWINILGSFSSKHFVEQLHFGVDTPVVRFGYRIFAYRVVSLIIPVENIRRVYWRTGQATHLAGRDMSDWQVVLWYELQEGASDDPESSRRPGEENYIVCSAHRKNITAAFGVKFVTFLNDAGAHLVQSENDCTYELADAN